MGSQPASGFFTAAAGPGAGWAWSGGDVGENAHFTFSGNTFSIPGRVVVFYGGSILYDSGCTGENVGSAGAGSKSLLISGSGSTVTVNVSPNCTGNTTGTAWDFTVGCPK